MNTRMLVHALGVATLLAVLASPVSATAVINIINLDGPGEGLNDPTPAAPVGGNPGTTIGQQRLLCLQRAAEIWGAALTSTVPINIQVAFNPIPCTPTMKMLGMTMPLGRIANHPALEFQGYWYPQALANQQAGVDLDPTANDIDMQISPNASTAGCLEPGREYYYGFDHNKVVGSTIDLLVVLLQEFAHGLGFTTMSDVLTGEYMGSPDNPLPGICDKFLYDETTGLHWDQMTPAQRVASAINTNNLTWDVPNRYNPDGSVHPGALNFMARQFLGHAPELLVPFGGGGMLGARATVGPQLAAGGVSSEAVMVVDNVAPTGDGCETITNAAALVGKIAVIDRGLCNLVFKPKQAQNAGAIGCIITNNVATPPLTTIQGIDATITIPSMMITQADGVLLKAAIASGPTHVTMRPHPTAIPGLSPSGRIILWAPNPPLSLDPQGTGSHFTFEQWPRLLMVPGINAWQTDDLDLTPYYLEDIGWTIPRTTSVPGSGPASRVALASHPNPAHTSASVHFELPGNETLQLTLYDVSGRQIRVLAKGAFAAGPHDVVWDGRDATGRRAAPGVYLARLKGARTQATHHLVLVN